MALLQISFDKDGNHKKTSFITSDNYYNVSVDNNILKDNAIFCYGFNTPPNLFTGVSALLNSAIYNPLGTGFEAL